MTDKRCVVCNQEAKAHPKYADEERGLHCPTCRKLYCADHWTRKPTEHPQIVQSICRKGHANPKREKCSECKETIWLLGAPRQNGVYCRECRAWYCDDHIQATKWEYPAPVVDDARRDVTCHNGHTFEESE